MTPEETRSAVAKARGEVECDQGAWVHLFYGNMGKMGKCSHTNCFPPGMLPAYDTNANAALTLVDAMAKDCNIDIHRRLEWVVTLWGFREETGKTIEARADTLPLAICRAYLAATA